MNGAEVSNYAGLKVLIPPLILEKIGEVLYISYLNLKG